MLVLITYDVNTETPAGRKRLRKVAKRCVDHGQRVQNSVFECLLAAAQYAVLKAELTALIDPALCIGCGQCAQYCARGAIVSTDPSTKGACHA